MQTATVIDMVRTAVRRPSVPDADPARVLTKAALRAADILEVPQRTLAEIIGVSASTVSRAANGGAPIDADSKSGELAKLWVRVFRSLDAIVRLKTTSRRAPGWKTARMPRSAARSRSIACAAPKG